ncbi:hypothetical protein H0H87_011695 [Tephrocybe sp. NHM501043]|nr:hypothetical protein H0H87_011695 [Tephrocybe sp. NHM501043]
MIIDKLPLPADPKPTDPHPSYDMLKACVEEREKTRANPATIVSNRLPHIHRCLPFVSQLQRQGTCKLRPPDAEGLAPDPLTSLILLDAPPPLDAHGRPPRVSPHVAPRVTPQFAPMRGTDEMLLGARFPMDEVLVRNAEGDEGAFNIDLEVVHFEERILVSKEVVVDFIVTYKTQMIFRKLSILAALSPLANQRESVVGPTMSFPI